MSGERSAWRMYALDAGKRRLMQVFEDVDAHDVLDALGGYELEHVPTGLRISWPVRLDPLHWEDLLEEMKRRGDLPGLLREAAEMCDQSTRRPGPRPGPVGGWGQLAECVAALWLSMGHPPTQEQVAEALDNDYSEASALARAVRSVGWPFVLVLAKTQLRWWQGRLGEQEEGEANTMGTLRRLDLTGF